MDNSEHKATGEIIEVSKRTQGTLEDGGNKAERIFEAKRPSPGHPELDTKWSVAVSCCFIAFFAASTHSNLGFFYVSFLETFCTDRRSAAWPGSIFEVVGHLAGIFVAILSKFVSIFYIGLIGSVVSWMGLLAAIFAPDIPWMAATFGMLHGAGVGIVLIAITVSIMTNFDKYRGVAAGLKYTGNSLSSLVLPKTLSVLGEAYSLRGTLLVYAGLCMNTTALMLFLKESKPRRAVVKVVSICCDMCYALRSVFTPNVTSNPRCVFLPKVSRGLGKEELWRLTSKLPSISVFYNEGLETKLKFIEIAVERGEMRKEDGTTTLNERRGALVIKIVEHGSLPKLNVPDTAKRRGSLAVAVAADAALTLSQDPNTRIQDPHFQDTETNEGTTFALFARPVFYALVLGALVTDYTVVIVHGTILDYALDKGVGRSKADLSMTYCSPAIFVGRLLLPLAADVGLIRRTALAAVCLVCMAGSALALPHTTSFIAYISVQSVLAADCFGAGAVPIYYGANGVALVPVLLANPAITGTEAGVSERHACLLMENCSANQTTCELDNIELKFLPPNTTARLQPLDR
ncbi:hypothetical protein HPB48_012194 [Haemaphysalis longicornis]|uniref:Monocarboxylate transporter n=1 Tax=Haemaphysalis longicornis TaxID=44386 RepID=A0A9J6GR45_HAELO|nr:hypothetical protein HPB48_012194 [Haemaphysalis longicornis]